MNAHPQITAKDLDIGYIDKDKVFAIAKALNLKLKAGEFVCLLGPNGAGKSTLIRTLAGMQKSLNGSLQLDHKILSQIAPRERARLVSIVLTDTFPLGMMDAYTLVSLGRHPYSGWLGSLNPQDHERIEWSLRAMGAGALAQRQISELSDGERQKISIARALAQEAKVMLLDEPTAFLDLPRRVELMSLLRNLAHQEKIGLLLSTHDLDLALRFADKLWVMTSDGQLIQGYPEELALNGEFAEAFANENLDWDIETASFQAHRTACLNVDFQGEGLHAIWTQRALARLGFGISKGGEAVSFSIQVTSENQWIIQHGDTSITCHSINEFINWIQGQNWSL